MKRHTPNNTRLAQGQKGTATLVVSLMVLMIIAMVSVFTSKSVFVEKKIANNAFRAQQALEAAEAGLAAAVEYYSENVDADSDGVLDPNVFDTNADGIGDANTATVGNGYTVTVTPTDSSPADAPFTVITVQSTGYSDDFTASRTLTQVLSTLNALPMSPDNPLTTRGSIIVSGSATVINPEGHSTIWSGSDVDLGSNNSTATEVADMTDAGYPTCMDTSMTCSTVASSNKVTVGLDVVEHDSSLDNLSQNQFFENFFGMTPANYREAMVTIDTTAASAATDIANAQGEVIWIEGNTSLSSITVGCSQNVTGSNYCPDGVMRPSIVIVNGDLELSGSPQFYGILFVNGAVSIKGGATVYGAMVASNDIANQTGGSLDITYHSDLLASASRNGPLGSSSGTWRDF